MVVALCVVRSLVWGAIWRMGISPSEVVLVEAGAPSVVMRVSSVVVYAPSEVVLSVLMDAPQEMLQLVGGRCGGVALLVEKLPGLGVVVLHNGLCVQTVEGRVQDLWVSVERLAAKCPEEVDWLPSVR